MERLPLLELDCFIYKYKSLQASQLPKKHLSFLQNLLNIIIKKYLKQEADDDLSICVDQRNLYYHKWRCKDLLMSRDQKLMTLLTPLDKCLMEFYQGVVLTTQI